MISLKDQDAFSQERQRLQDSFLNCLFRFLGIYLHIPCHDALPHAMSHLQAVLRRPLLLALCPAPRGNHSGQAGVQEAEVVQCLPGGTATAKVGAASIHLWKEKRATVTARHCSVG